MSNGVALIVAISFAIQQFVELADTLLFRTEESRTRPYRMPLLKLLSVAIGLAAAFTCTDCMAVTSTISNHALRLLITAFGLAGGTEGANSLIKFAQYTKDNKRAVAASAQEAADGQFVLHARTQPKE